MVHTSNMKFKIVVGILYLQRSLVQCTYEYLNDSYFNQNAFENCSLRMD